MTDTTIQLLASLRSQATLNSYTHDDDAKHLQDHGLTDAKHYDIRLRQLIERAVVRQAITDLLAAGHTISLNNGGDQDEVSLSTDLAALMASIQETDEEYLLVYPKDADGTSRQGWIRLIYGNDGWDVMNDYTTNLGVAINKADTLASELGELL